MLTISQASKLGLGTVKFGRNQGVKYPHQFTIPTTQHLADLLSLAQELGINFIDTAPAYGNSEEKLGKLLIGQRSKWLLSTKVGEQFINNQSQFDFSPEAIITSVHSSLQRLKTDYLDCVLVHSNGDDETIINQYGALETLQQLKKQGLIRYIGMSTKTYSGSLLALEQADGVMIEYNITIVNERRIQQQQIIARAFKEKKFIFIKKAFNSGYVTDIMMSLDDIFIQCGVTSVVVGTINPDHLRQNIVALPTYL